MLGGIANHKDYGAGFQVGSFNSAAAATGVPVNASGFDQSPQGAQQSESLSAIVAFTPTVFGALDTLSLELLVQESVDNSVWTDASAEHQPVADLAVAGPQTVGAAIVRRYDLKISSLQKYVRFVITPTLGGAAAGALDLVGIYGGGLSQPQHVRAFGSLDWQPTYAA